MRMEWESAEKLENFYCEETRNVQSIEVHYFFGPDLSKLIKH